MPACNTPDKAYEDPELEMDAGAVPRSVPPHLRTKKTSTLSGSGDAQDHGASVPPSDPDGVREKLSEMGVKVGEPKPASPALVNYPSSVDEPKVSKAKSRNSGIGVTLRNDLEARDGPEKAARKRPANQRGRGRGGRAAPREERWPKKGDIPKTDPHRWDTVRSSNSSELDSACADSGFGVGKKKRAAVGEQKLTDFNGNWAPAPLDWDSRPAFRDEQNATQIERWMDKIVQELCGITVSIPHEDLTLSDGSVRYFAPDPKMKDLLLMGDVAPRYWAPIVIGNQAPQTFWNDLLKSNEPEPLDEGDLNGSKPWWDLYHVKGGNFLRPAVHPAITGIDPDEALDERLARENDNGSLQHTQNRISRDKAKRDAQRQRREKAAERARKFNFDSLITKNEQIKPAINLYVRSARPDDITQIRDIYNHYIDFAACTPETRRCSTPDMLQRYRDILDNKLPFLVACERGEKVTSRKKRTEGEDLILPDRVVGFAFADDYNDMQGLYRFTAELEVYTHKSHYMKGVAKCLLDKLIGLLDPGYVERGGFTVEGEELDGIGCSRVIQNVIVNLPHEKPERLEWVGRWLGNWLGFEQVGNLTDIGNKDGKR